jgi:hypothetical protein
MTDIFLGLAIWIALIASFIRSWRQGQLKQRSDLTLWGVFGSMAAAYLFRMQVAEEAINQHFDMLPVAFAIKIFFVILAASLYFRVLNQVQPATRSRYLWLAYLNPITAMGILLALWLGSTGWFDHQQTFYFMIAISDFLIFLYMILMFLPVNIYLLRQEELRPLQIKHCATIVFCGSYAVVTGMSSISSPIAVMTGYVSPIPDLIPLATIVFCCIIILLLPYRYFQKLFLVEQLYWLFKLRHIERKVTELSGRVSQLPRRINLFNQKSVEAAIYTALISILDYSRQAANISEAGQSIYKEIMNAAEVDAEYDTLVRAIAKVKIDGYYAR